MGKEKSEVQEVRIDALVPFNLCSHQPCGGEKLERLKGSIEKSEEMHPIIVRPFGDEEQKKYEIISGHNRTRAMEELGRETISAEILDGLSDHDAIGLFYDAKLSKQLFSDWNYSQRIEAVRYYEKIIRKNSHQGKRTDLEEKKIDGIGEKVIEQSRQKLEENFELETESRQKLEQKLELKIESRQKLEAKIKRATTRDKIACYLGISTATLSKYRSIIKLPNDIVDRIGQLLDKEMMTFKAAYRISRSKVRKIDIRTLLRCIEKSPNKKIDMGKLEKLLNSRKTEEKGVFYPIYDDVFNRVLVPKNSKRTRH